MKLKKLVSVMLVGAMAATMLAGCGGSSSEEATTAAASASEEGSASEEAETSAFTGFDEPQEIKMYAMNFYGDGGVDEVEEAINAISSEAINVTIELNLMDVATYMEQIGLMLSGGEAFDLVMITAVPVVGFSTMTSQSELMDISPYLDEYAPDAVSLVGDYLNACKIGDAVYSLPDYRQYNTNLYMNMRKDILEELDLLDDFENMETWTDVENLMITIRDAQDSLPEDLQTNCVMANADQGGNVLYSSTFDTAAEELSGTVNFDNLGDLYKIIYADEETDTVENFYESEDYKTIIERVHKWYDEGLIHKEAATEENSADTMIANGVAACVVTPSQYGVEAAKTKSCGREMVSKLICKGATTTDTANTWGWAVPTTSENPEAAVAFLNLMYTNADIENLLVYGIEGRDYEVNDEGEAHVLDTAEYMDNDWCFGNQFDVYPNEGAGSTFREDAEQDMIESGTSKYFGCVVDTSAISNEITAVANVLNKYQGGLESGTTDPSELDNMNSELQSSGVQTVLDYYQSSLDAFLGK